MTTYGPCRRFTIRTPDAIIFITGSNMLATIIGCEGSAPSQGFSIGGTDVSLQNGAVARSKSGSRGDCPASGSSYVGESSSNQSLTSSDVESDSSASDREEIPRQIPPELPEPTMTSIDRDFSKRPKDTRTVGPATDECESPNHSEPDHDSTAQGSPISASGSYYYSDNDSEHQLSSEPGHKRRNSDGEETNEKEHSLVTRKRLRSQVGGDVRNNTTGVDSSASGLQLQSIRRQPSLKKKSTKRLSNDSYGEKFRTTRRITRHLSTHTRASEHLCTTCGNTFASAQSLARHTRIHTGEKPYSCDICGKTFIASGNLARHTRVHTGEKPYLCNTCGKAFITSGDLTKHTQTHNGVKPYTCDTCGKAFTHSGNLSKHLRIHTGEKPYTCGTCGKAFSIAGNLSMHLLIHTGERPYTCETCGKTFTQNGNLAQHVRIHTGEKPYQCDVCGKSFTTSSQLARHAHLHTR